jgi:hypothetical protein
MPKRLLTLVIIAVCGAILFKAYGTKPETVKENSVISTISGISPNITVPPVQPLPVAKTLKNNYHVFQTFNNCGPAALSMALSYYGISKSQKELGQDLRPYQNAQGNNDDKSVTLDELADKALEFKLIPFHRPNGTVELIKQFILSDIPVITRTRLTEIDDIGHYRIIKGFDDISKEFIQDDSLQGQNLRYPYVQFNKLWKMFNYEYLVLVPVDKEQIARNIINEDIDEKTAWINAANTSREELSKNPNDIYARFNLSIALYHTGNYQKAVSEFEVVDNMLPFRTLWYQIEPILSYYELGNYQKVFEITNNIFNNQNRAFSELYVLRGEVYKKQQNNEAAKKEFEKAIYYNKNLKSAQSALQSLQ